MSVASKVGQVIFSQKSGVYMPAIMCDKGDLYQEYDGESGAPTNIAPDFTTMKPTLSFLLTGWLRGLWCPLPSGGISMTC